MRYSERKGLARDVLSDNCQDESGILTKSENGVKANVWSDRHQAFFGCNTNRRGKNTHISTMAVRMDWKDSRGKIETAPHKMMGALWMIFFSNATTVTIGHLSNF
jgi:hypothetical protein